MTSPFDLLRQHQHAAVSISLVSGFLILFVLTGTPLVNVAPASTAIAGDPNHGEELFEKRCGGCHALDSDKEGPRLRSVYGRRSGSISTFKYSPALKSGTVVWDENLLD